MNRLTLSLIFASIIGHSTFVSAQIEKGNYIIGGNAMIENLSSANVNTSGYNVNSLSINPTYGKFLSDRFLIGANATFTNRFTLSGRGNIAFKGGPIMRYYFNNIFLQADYNLACPSRLVIEHDLYAKLGYAYFLNDHVAIEPYIFIGVRDLIYLKTPYAYLDKGIYFSIQVYLESSLNKIVKMRKDILKNKK